MRERLISLWNLRLSPDRRTRVGWYLSVLVGSLVLLCTPVPLNVFMVCATAVSGLLCCIAGLWGLFHPRSVWPGLQAAWRWAAWMTIIALAAGYAGALQWATGALAVAVPTVGVLFVLVAVLPVAFGLLFCYGWLGAAVSAFVVRRWQDSRRLTQVGINAWWLLTLGTLLAMATNTLSPERNQTIRVLLTAAPFFSVPLATIALCALARNPEHEPRRIAERLLQRLSRYLTFRRRWRGRTIAFDFRGAMLGLLLSAAVFGLLRPVLKTPGASLLVGMIQMRNQEAQGAWNRNQENNQTDNPTGVLGAELARYDKEILARRREIVLIDLDTVVMRGLFASPARKAAAPHSEKPVGFARQSSAQVATVDSEAAVDALLVRRLHELGAKVVVLLPPQEQDSPSPKNGAATSFATNTVAERRRSIRDESLLAAAAKEAGNVVLAVPRHMPSLHYSGEPIIVAEIPAFADLRGAAAKTGEEDLVSYGSVKLPVLQAGDKERPASLPFLIAQAYGGASQAAAGGIYGRSMTPVDFRSAKPDHDFLHIPASSLLTPLPTDKAAKELVMAPDGQWNTLEESIRGRIVFLDTLLPRLRETPVGAISSREVLAYGTATVLAHARGLRVATTRSLLLTLLVGTLMGALCAHRTPFEAAGRMICLSLLMIAASLICYMVWTLWLDAVVPLAAILATYLLVTQLAFTQEREKNRDLLKRFVAPEFVDAMLANPQDHLGLEGKLSHICVLFADVRNFTGFAENHSPEQVFEAVNQYMTALTNALHVYGGVLDKYTGDGLMAWFPTEGESRLKIEKAVKAALAMRDAALEISSLRTEQHKPALHFGIGMHYGEAMIGLVGNEEHQINYTALGHAVIVSARLQTLAAGGELIVSETVFAALAENFQVEARDPVAVKGIHDLVRPYLIISDKLLVLR